MIKFIWPIQLILYIFISSIVCEDLQLERIFPSCSLLGDSLHCFGGGIKESVNIEINESTNEHIILDLKVYDEFQNLNPSNAIWKSAPNNINKGSTSVNLSPLTLGSITSISSSNSFIILGGYNNYMTMSNSLEFPFIKYDASSSQWSSLSAPPNYTTNVTIVDLKNDQIWAWGLNSNNNSSSGILSIFNLSNFTWTQPLSTNMPAGRYGHTATLDNKGIIHVIGGYIPSLNAMVPLRNVSTFNTNTYQWNDINATITTDIWESSERLRIHHTTTHIPNTDLLVIYGGMQFGSSPNVARNPKLDIYYIYDTNNSTFSYFSIPEREILNSKYGHFAAIYNNYLLLSFGGSRIKANSFTESLAVLNIMDPTKPKWMNITDPKITTLSTKFGLSAGEIAAIVISIVLGISIIVGVFMYFRHKKRRQEKAFVLENEDPRKNIGGHYESQNNSFVIKPFDSGENEKYTTVKPTDGKLVRCSSALSDSNETNGHTEISDNSNKTLT